MRLDATHQDLQIPRAALRHPRAQAFDLPFAANLIFVGF
jgi:hypothetical protein